MIFSMLAFVVVLTSAIFWLFGFMPPNGSIWDILFSSQSITDVFTNVLGSLWNSAGLFSNLFGALTTIVAGGAVAAGIYFNRDEPLYGGLGVLIFKMLGLYSIITYAELPATMATLAIVVMGLFNALFIISFINWIRGKGE